MKRVLLVLPTSTYRAPDFLAAARAVGAEVVIASEEEQALAGAMGDRFVRVDLCDPEAAAREIVERTAPLDAVVGVDEQGVLVAAHAAAQLGLPHNPPDAVAATRNKARLRKLLTAAGLDQPATGDVGFPCIVKATNLSGSRGVIRADTDAELMAAIRRVSAIAGDGGPVLVEEYVPGAEVAVEGLLRKGSLEVLAVFDKPDPLEGPYFEETIYVTPSRLPAATRASVAETTSRACEAIGLVDGPIHAELRVDGDRVVLLEVAARSIGGLCSRSLRFGAGISLEEVILRHALSLDTGELRRTDRASGVMMIPIPRAGRLRSVGGIDHARGFPLIEGIEITIPSGRPVTALPEGDRYLGFIFASGASPELVEQALRNAHSALDIGIMEA